MWIAILIMATVFLPITFGILFLRRKDKISDAKEREIEITPIVIRSQLGFRFPVDKNVPPDMIATLSRLDDD